VVVAAAAVVAAAIGTVINNHEFDFCRGDVRRSVAPFSFYLPCLRKRLIRFPVSIHADFQDFF
jgi:hypothetical protein